MGFSESNTTTSFFSHRISVWQAQQTGLWFTIPPLLVRLAAIRIEERCLCCEHGGAKIIFAAVQGYNPALGSKDGTCQVHQLVPCRLAPILVPAVVVQEAHLPTSATVRRNSEVNPGKLPSLLTSFRFPEVL